jgi:glucose-1-phosphate cytidylyltransferase
MKVVILAGGLGTRLSEYTKHKPKPMVDVAGKPILVHIMNHYSKYGFTDFYIALGYKGQVIKNYFKKNKYDWNINLIDTGLNTMTGGRLKRLEPYFEEGESFMMTYGDSIANVNLKKLKKYHEKKKSLVTLTAVKPSARFGAIKLKRGRVEYFKEKSRMDEGWINGGFMIMEKKFLKLIKNDQTFLERKPLEMATKIKKLYAFKHAGFWQCMDTKRDKDRLEEILKNKKF